MKGQSSQEKLHFFKMIHFCVDKALVYFDCEFEFSATSHLHIYSASVYSNIILVFVSKCWTHFMSVSSWGVYDLASFFEHFKLKIMAVSFKLHLFKVAFSLWNWKTNTSQFLWTVDNWCRSHCWCMFVDLKVEVTRLWRRLPASQPLCAQCSLRGLLFFFFFLRITSDWKVLRAAKFWDSVFTGGAQFAHRWDSNRKPNKSWHIWTLVAFNSLFTSTEDKWPGHTVGMLYYSGIVKQKETSYRLPWHVSLECVSSEPLSFMWTRSPMTTVSISACFGGFYSDCTGGKMGISVQSIAICGKK